MNFHSHRILSPYLVVVVEEAKGVGAVLVPIDAHHGLGGGRERVLQVRPPCLVLAGVGPSHCAEGALVGDHHHHALTSKISTFVMVMDLLSELVAIYYKPNPRGCFTSSVKILGPVQILLIV